MAKDKIITNTAGSKRLRSVLYMGFVGVCIGVISGLVGRLIPGMIGAAILLSIFSAYNRALKRNNGIVSGLYAGGVIGLVVGAISFLFGDEINGVWNGALFGLARGLLIGAVIGAVTRAQPDEGDKWTTVSFLFAASIVVGAILGACVGVVSGFIIGLIQLGWWGKLVAVLVGGIVGGYLGSFYSQRRIILISGGVGAILAVSSSLIGGAVAGVVLGMISGAMAPMLLVAAIGAMGGLSSRGVMAMVVEAVEAPSEMVIQGAVPFLAPAVMVGIIVGTGAAGADGLIALPVCLAIVGMFLGVFREIEGKYSSQVTVRNIVEMVILGADEWPIGEVISYITGVNRKTAVIGAVIGIIIGVIGVGIGFLLEQQVAILIDNMLS